jgi:hypothetical protein
MWDEASWDSERKFLVGGGFAAVKLVAGEGSWKLLQWQLHRAMGWLRFLRQQLFIHGVELTHGDEIFVANHGQFSSRWRKAIAITPEKVKPVRAVFELGAYRSEKRQTTACNRKGEP